LDFGVCDVSWQEAPEHHVQRACPELLIPHNDGLHSLRRDVVIGGEFKSESVNVAEVKGFGYFLFVATSLVSAAHIYLSAILVEVTRPYIQVAEVQNVYG